MNEASGKARFITPRGVAAVAIACLVIAFVCCFLDRRVVDFIDAQWWPRPLWRLTHQIPPVVLPGTLALIAFGGALAFAQDAPLRPLSLSLLAVLLGAFVTELILKPLLGRFDILTAYRHNDFGFHLLGGGGAFPSGHATLIAAAATTYWIGIPRTRWIGAVIVALASVTLVAKLRHFLGDVLAGDLVGVLSGYAVVCIAERFAPLPRPAITVELPGEPPRPPEAPLA